MRIAFYAPLKSPEHAVPSGDRRVARLLMDVLHLAGHDVELVSELRSFDAGGDDERQAAIEAQGRAIVQQLLARWRGDGAPRAPELWFTYHLYYKAPDWLGPAVAAELQIPYVAAEASFAAKRAGGPWARGHAAALQAIRAADLLLCPTADDVAGLAQVAAAHTAIERLPPFLDPAPYQAAAAHRAEHRRQLATAHDLPDGEPWIAVAAMMRPGDKLASYEVLARSLAPLQDLPWRLVVAGDGTARDEVHALFERAVPGRAVFLGACDAGTMTALYAACDLYVWPAVNEAYGMAMLEAQAAGLPVVSCAVRGVPDVVCDGTTGLLAAAVDATAIGDCVRSLLADPARRVAMGRAAAAFVAGERSTTHAAELLAGMLARLPATPNVGAA